MPTRVKRKPLSRQRVLAAATDLADREGLQAVTMRRLAGSLGVEAMSLYHHLPGKQGLLDGLVEALLDEVGDEVDRLDEADGWRQAVRARILAARRVMLRHPWGPVLIGSQPGIPPGAYSHFEDVLALMIEGGLSYRLAHRAMHALGSMVLGFTQELFSPGGASMSEDEVDAAAAEQLAEMAELLPHLTAMVAAELHESDDPTLGWCDSQVEFEFTLDLLLDGLERQRSEV